MRINEWQKLCALLMHRLNVRAVVITSDEIRQVSESYGAERLAANIHDDRIELKLMMSAEDQPACGARFQ